jgi:hypothetical protein
VVPQGLDVLFPFVLFGDFRSLLLVIFLERFRNLSLWDLVADVCMNPSWFFPFDSSPKSVGKGARFWGFQCFRVRGVLGGISSIPLDLASFGGQKSWLWSAHGCSYYPKVLRKSMERFRRSGVGFGGLEPRVLFIPRAQVTPV